MCDDSERKYVVFEYPTYCNCSTFYGIVSNDNDLFNLITSNDDNKINDDDIKLLNDFISLLNSIKTIHKCLIRWNGKTEHQFPFFETLNLKYSIHSYEKCYTTTFGHYTYEIYIVDNPYKSKFKIVPTNKCMCFSDYPFIMKKIKH